MPITPLWIVERRTIEDAIARCGGNVNRAAAALEISPSTIYRKMERWDEDAG
jgi:two-component system repressor protein LuxO